MKKCNIIKSIQNIYFKKLQKRIIGINEIIHLKIY